MKNTQKQVLSSSLIIVLDMAVLKRKGKTSTNLDVVLGIKLGLDNKKNKIRQKMLSNFDKGNA